MLSILRTVIFLVCFLLMLKILGQDIPNLIPPSPAAQAIQRVSIDQMNYYTGAVEVNLPLHTLKLRELSVPIVLSNTGQHGIKLQEIASWVGLGWSLISGGAVSREIRHLPDDGLNGYYGSASLPPDNAWDNGAPAIDSDNNGLLDLYEIQIGSKDAEPDYYHYSAPGVSGSFFIQKDGSILPALRHVPAWILRWRHVGE